MKLIVGLGNPGPEYEYTRHNMGFMVIDSFAKKHGVSISKKKFNGLYEIVEIGSTKVILLKPLSYMNLSGMVVKEFVHYFKVDIDDNGNINFDIEKELGVEIVGETKMKISIEEDEDPWDEIEDEVDENVINEIDQEVNENYIEEEKNESID